MSSFVNLSHWILGFILILSSLGVVIARRPIYASLSFLLSLLMLAAIYVELSAQFIGVMQVFVYAGAILVIFVFVIVLFQDAHLKIDQYKSKSNGFLLAIALSTFFLTLIFFGRRFINHVPSKGELPTDFGTVQSLGQTLYVDFFFPFEAITLIFLVAVVGALYIAKREY